MMLLGCAAALMLLPISQTDRSVPEAPIIFNARHLGEGRYVSPQNYEDTLAYYRRFFRRRGGVRWRTIAHLPSIKAMHMQNLRRVGDWDGINIYEHQGETRIFVLYRPQKASPRAARATKK